MVAVPRVFRHLRQPSTHPVLRPHRLIAFVCLLSTGVAACGARRQPVPAPRPPDLLSPATAGGVALGIPSGRASPCRAQDADPVTQGLGYARFFALEDTATTLPRWSRSLTLDVDSAGRPRRLRALAVLPGMPGTPGTFNPFGPADRVDVVVAFLAADGHVEGGLLLSRGLDEPAPHHYYTGDPLPASLHAASVRLARMIRARCER